MILEITVALVGFPPRLRLSSGSVRGFTQRSANNVITNHQDVQDLPCSFKRRTAAYFAHLSEIESLLLHRYDEYTAAPLSLKCLPVVWYIIGDPSERKSGLAEDYSANQMKCRSSNRKWENEMSFPYRLSVASLLDLMTHYRKIRANFLMRNPKASAEGSLAQLEKCSRYFRPFYPLRPLC